MERLWRDFGERSEQHGTTHGAIPARTLSTFGAITERADSRMGPRTENPAEWLKERAGCRLWYGAACPSRLPNFGTLPKNGIPVGIMQPHTQRRHGALLGHYVGYIGGIYTRLYTPHFGGTSSH